LRPSLRQAFPLLFLSLTLALGCATTSSPTAPASAPAAAREEGDRTALLLAVNDIYRIEGVENGTAGDLARLRTLRTTLEGEAPDLLMFHAGDLLSPSFLSRSYRGQQMIDVLNLLDGDPAGFDRRLFIVFGNHEFDRDDLSDAPLLDQRVEESQFNWVNGNVVFVQEADGKPLVDAANLAPSYLAESGGIRFGIFGLTTDIKHPAYVESFRDPVDTARQLTADLRAKGAEVVVALTHLDKDDDLALLEKLGAAGPDLILGGHDHDRMILTASNGHHVFKADSDARTATVVRLTRHRDGRLDVRGEHVTLSGDSPRPDPAVQARVDAWLQRHEKEFCEKAGSPPGCLKTVLGRTRTAFVAEENKIRSQETSAGDWLADLMVQAYAPCGAQAAIINSGSLRLNQDLEAGTEFTREHLEELFGFPAPLHLIRIDGRTLQEAADHGVQSPGQGAWPQVSGIAFSVGNGGTDVADSASRKAGNLTLLTPQGARPVRPDEPILVVVPAYLIDPTDNQDGYTMLSAKQQVTDCAVGNADLKVLAQTALGAAEPQGIAPVIEGRICPAAGGSGCKTVSPSVSR
jgi:2',3'-cyclic-nucleotide 2'-phosphodiesterase (5'-nucleotidase family)